MPKPISPKIHGVIDYLSVPLLLAAGPLFHFSGMPREITSTLAGVALVYSAFTAYPLGLVKMISFRMHGVIDIVFALVLLVAPFVLHFAEQSPARNFFMTMGLFSLAVISLTDWKRSGDVQRS
jgi:hypothetical protein